MEQRVKDREAYRKITGAFKTRRQGATVADIVAQTALPLQTVRELAPLAADEYSARLEVTESGEIRYSFPQGFTSKYRGFRAGLRRISERIGKGLGIFGTWVFKIWIMVMLVGYFVLFMLIALAALLVSTAVSVSGSNNRSDNRGGGLGGLYLSSSIFNLIIRIWFYSELTRSMNRPYGRNVQGLRPRGRPLYKAIFSFVFGEDDQEADRIAREKRAFISYLHTHRGVISLPEFMALSGLPPSRAEAELCSRCAEFGGMPEVTEEGTLVYRFDDLLLRSDAPLAGNPGASPLVRGLKKFSGNTKKMNGWFALINGINLGFGSYFLFNALYTGLILSQAHFDAASYLYKITYLLLDSLGAAPLPFITVGLGIIPLVFSALFWGIPLVRYILMRKENEDIKMENLRKSAFSRIWFSPRGIREGDIRADQEECRPKNLAAARDRVIKEMGSYTIPDVAADSGGAMVYTFPELEREKEALEKYRKAINPADASLGKTVFDSHGKEI
ncbi:MAG: hypothetical protein LBP43_07130 [Treponema sp.]|jgi:hypothetical protein|nr:hypothetical protein [Treponema sp.]